MLIEILVFPLLVVVVIKPLSLNFRSETATAAKDVLS